MFHQRVFNRDWWLEGISLHRISVYEVYEQDRLTAKLPLMKRHRVGKPLYETPVLSQTSGPDILPFEGKAVNRIAYLKRILETLIDSLPSNASYNFVLDASTEYFLPFIWKGFRLSPKVSYRISNLTQPTEAIFDSFSSNIRNKIRKAQRLVKINHSASVEDLCRMMRLTYERQHTASPYDEAMVCRVVEKAISEEQGVVFSATDEAGNLHGAAFFLFDEDVCYYLFSGTNPQYRHSQALALLVWEGIMFASEKHIGVFDFEGSNIERIETFFREFTNEFVVHYRVEKYLLRHRIYFALADVLRPIFTKIKAIKK